MYTPDTKQSARKKTQTYTHTYTHSHKQGFCACILWYAGEVKNKIHESP